MSLKSKVFGAYRLLQRTCLQVFAGDTQALHQSRFKIKESFLANKNVEPHKVEDLIVNAKETSEFLLENVLQARLTSDNVYKLKITEKTKLQDNVLLKDSNTIDLMCYKVPEQYKKKE
ncbi:uncharacterized protein LOC100211491 [Hydra vulgaris]|uniref:uncharacterized protein LOC100211491 n=1 Tax=Hydra vulgaris TaxID=6087 RepID=UPI00019246C3|nr:mitochondrial zinc maintenance protein 1, mitochondrial-like [Hydra vulgaris]